MRKGKIKKRPTSPDVHTIDALASRVPGTKTEDSQGIPFVLVLIRTGHNDRERAVPAPADTCHRRLVHTCRATFFPGQRHSLSLVAQLSGTDRLRTVSPSASQSQHFSGARTWCQWLCSTRPASPAAGRDFHLATRAGGCEHRISHRSESIAGRTRG
jgi:hypothetical protein